jgi:hypothetical protein
MSMTFTKLFSSITESTVWCEPDRVRIVWITMLAMADSRGRVWASIPGLANRARVPVDDAKAAIERFLAPDEYSRTPDNDGRRVVPIDGGWRLLNHEKYRAIRDEEAINESKRKYINTRRALERESNSVDTVDRSRHNAEAEADTEAKTLEPNVVVAGSSAAKASAKRGSRLPDDWKLPKAWGQWALAEFGGWTAETVRLEAAKFADYWHAKAGNDAAKLDWSATWRNWCRNATPSKAAQAATMPGPEVWKAPPPLSPDEIAAADEVRRRIVPALKRVSA